MIQISPRGYIVLGVTYFGILGVGESHTIPDPLIPSAGRKFPVEMESATRGAPPPLKILLPKMGFLGASFSIPKLMLMPRSLLPTVEALEFSPTGLMVS